MNSAKNQIRIILFLVAILCLTISFISLLYINEMSNRIKMIVDEDAKMADLGEYLSIQMLEARRDEKNFVIYQDTVYIQNNIQKIDQMHKIIAGIHPQALDYHTLLDSIASELSIYQNNIQNLKKILQEDPRTLSRLQRQLQTYERDLAQLKNSNEASSVDQLQLAIMSVSSKLSSERTALFMDLKTVGDRIQTLGQNIADQANLSLVKHSNDGIRYSIKAQRNIFTLLFLITFILVYVIYALPRRIFAPYNRIIRALEAIGRGETDTKLPIFKKRSEFSDLSDAFQEAVYKLQTFGAMKTDKIVSIQRNLNRLLEEIDEAVVILSADFLIKTLNKSAKSLFDVDSDLLGHPFSRIDVVWQQIDNELKNIEKTGRFEKPLKGKIAQKNLVVLPIMSPTGKLESIIMMFHH